MFFQNAYAQSVTVGLPQASTMALKSDALNDWIFWLSVISLGGVTIALLYFMVKYNRSNKGRETAYILGNHTLELIWTIIPLFLMLFMFSWAYKDYLFFRKEPVNPVEINVTGRQWLWNFEYPNGRRTMNEFFMPKDKPIKLILTSEDVLHSFFLPNMRVKTDIVPGMYVYLSYTATMTGAHPVYCTEYCGTDHSRMLAKAYVLEPQDYDNWLTTGKAPDYAFVPRGDARAFSSTSGVSAANDSKGVPTTAVSAIAKAPAQHGKEVFSGKGACYTCHSVDGSRKIGPSLSRLFGSTVELADGSKAKVDENYLRESMMEPNAKLVKGYPATMPTFKGVLSDQEINALVTYIKSLQ